MSDLIELSARARGISRICHFTPSRNLQHIAAGQIGILSTASLRADERRAFNPTDLKRYDGKQGHVCCSIEYPNAWYFDKARANEPIFPDWVVLLVKPDYLWKEGTLFSPGNAAAGFGANIRSGFEGFESLFGERVAGTNNRVWVRSPAHMPACPTDQQAEVLVEDRIMLEDVIAVAVPDVEQAEKERVRLEINQQDPDLFQFVVAPAMFSKWDLGKAIQYGVKPSEKPVAAWNSKAGK